MGYRAFNSANYFQRPIIDSSGFREYDARWLVEPLSSESDDIQLNYRGLVHLGACLGRFLQMPENGQHTRILVGHDFRSYAENVKNALTLGLVSSGMEVLDAGLCLTPMLYFAQYEYKIPACAMVTASHNSNGWTGIKMAHDYSLTFGPEQMKAFKAVVEQDHLPLTSSPLMRGYQQTDDLLHRYLDNLRTAWTPRLAGKPRLRVAVETGNGTAGLVFPRLLQELGFDVVSGHVDLDWTFPNFNPNPESVPFLRSVQTLVKDSNAEVGICLDGDGDRLGVIDDQGKIVFSDRVGIMLAKRLVELEGPGKIVVDIKSTSLFDKVLPNCEIVWEKTGHSYIKAALKREHAIAGFERSGHFFLQPPYGRGYDDACTAALFLLWVLSDAKADAKQMSDILATLPASHQSPTRQPHVPDARKYEIVEEVRGRIEAIVEKEGGTFGGLRVQNIVTINGVRVNFEDGSWLLIRASSNTPNLSIVAETFDDGSMLRSIDAMVRMLLRDIKEVGDFDALHEI